MSVVETKASRSIAKRLEQLEPGTPRYEALEIAKQFKRSWVDLGAKLWDVRQKKLFREWGFEKFEHYCQDEICIKPRTAAKLTASYAFLRSEEPAVLKRDGIVKPLPDMQTVDVLRKARKTDGLGDEEYKKIKDMALKDTPVTELRKELRQHRPDPEPPSNEKVIKQILAQAHKLADSLASLQGIPHVIVERALALVDDIRALIKA